MTITRRADLTHQHNTMNGRHGWLRLTPAYSVKVVDDIIGSWPKDCKVLDPFSGTATTPLCSSFLGHQSAAIDINPFLVWFGQAKLANYGDAELKLVRELACHIVSMLSSHNAHLNMSAIPPLYNITRWWHTDELKFLRKLKYCIDAFAPERSQVWSLLMVAFCRTMIRTSNAAFDHQSMSFKEENPHSLIQLMMQDTHVDSALAHMYQQDIEYILCSAADNPLVEAELVQGDSRHVGVYVNGVYDLVVTSPPYPNRMSYIRELRPYMYWLGYFEEACEAGELDWQAIGGTWGVATSRLTQWQSSNDTYCPAYLNTIVEKIAHAENKHSKLLATYITKYFEDAWTHLRSITPVVSSGGEVHYIVGNSTFYDILLPVEQIYHDMLLELGFVDVSIRVLRKRNSKKELLEYEVCGRKK